MRADIGKRVVDMLGENRDTYFHLLGANINQHKQWLESIDKGNESEFISDFISTAAPQTPDVLIVIPVRDRKDHLRKVIECLAPQIERTNDRVAIVVSEFSSFPAHRDFCRENNVNYLFHKSELFNKSCAMNQAVVNYPGVPKNVLFHDVDIVVDDGWVDDVLVTADMLHDTKGHSWICQTIKDRKVEYVSEENTSRIFSEEISLDALSNIDHHINQFWFQGRYPPGGSILVPIELFSAVSGYDSHIYWGYSPEDVAFLESCMFAAATTEVDVLETSARSYHLFHPITEKTNMNYEFMVATGKMIKTDAYIRLLSMMMKANVGLVTSHLQIKWLELNGNNIRESLRFYPCLRKADQTQFYSGKNSWTHPEPGVFRLVISKNINCANIMSMVAEGRFAQSVFNNYDEMLRRMSEVKSAKFDTSQLKTKQEK